MVRSGLLSTAAINGAILGARAAHAPFEIVAVGSRDASRAEAYAHEHGIERAHGSYEELLGDDGVDAVYIALPNAFHHEWTMRALAAGKHVLVEKPRSSPGRAGRRVRSDPRRTGSVARPRRDAWAGPRARRVAALRRALGHSFEVAHAGRCDRQQRHRENAGG